MFVVYYGYARMSMCISLRHYSNYKIPADTKIIPAKGEKVLLMTDNVFIDLIPRNGETVKFAKDL